MVQKVLLGMEQILMFDEYFMLRVVHLLEQLLLVQQLLVEHFKQHLLERVLLSDQDDR